MTPRAILQQAIRVRRPDKPCPEAEPSAETQTAHELGASPRPPASCRLSGRLNPVCRRQRVVTIHANAHYTLIFNGGDKLFCARHRRRGSTARRQSVVRVHRSHIVNIDRVIGHKFRRRRGAEMQAASAMRFQSAAVEWSSSSPKSHRSSAKRTPDGWCWYGGDRIRSEVLTQFVQRCRRSCRKGAARARANAFVHHFLPMRCTIRHI